MQSSIRRCALSRTSLIRPLSYYSRNYPATGFQNVKPIVFTRYASTSTNNPFPSLDLPSLDQKWRAKWTTAEKPKSVKDNEQDEGQKMYILPMFPYPSGDLHLGHFRAYTISDVLARFHTMRGYNVVHPIGWDAFGLPAENAAIERGIDPAVWTKQNIQKMKSQLITWNGRWDWDREITTCDPNFYKHTQEIFLLLHERGLAYQAESLVNYDPVDKTVLANEQVDANGNSWRSGAKVEKRLLKQWFLKISEFREQLLQDIDHLAKGGMWPERVLAMQKNWLGKSKGARIQFSISAGEDSSRQPVEVFTTRPDTIYGVQYIALAATHPIVQGLAKKDTKLQQFLDSMSDLPPDSKVGYLLPTVSAVHPLASRQSTPEASKAPLPVYVAPYVLGDYGDGAVMGVPAHDARDHAFWKHNNHDTPPRHVIGPVDGASKAVPADQPFVHPGHLTSENPRSFVGQTTAKAKQSIMKLLQNEGLGSAAETWRLRDWLVSRQRYWGTPIPIIHCASCGPVPVPKDQLPVKLPSVEGHWLKGKAGNPLDGAHDWVNVPCPKCGSDAKRDTDTMDTFVDSSWYFMRFADPKNSTTPFSPEAANAILPVDVYIGGVEHAILHLLYARFISKFLSTTPLWPEGSTKNILGEPFKKLLSQGMVHGKTYLDPSNGRFLKPEEVDLTTPSKPILIASGEIAKISYEKMSKSKYNGVDPAQCMTKYGADATRAHMIFQAPVTEVLEWDEQKISGITRWLKRLHDYICTSTGVSQKVKDHMLSPKDYLLSAVDVLEKSKRNNLEKQDSNTGAIVLDTIHADIKLWRAVQQSITNITEAYSETHSLNTIVSDLMSLTNLLIETTEANKVRRETSHTDVIAGLESANWVEEKSGLIENAATKILLQMMAPITPAFAEECWSISHGDVETFSIFETKFPETDGSINWLLPETQKCAVQVNGKLRFAIDIPIPEEGMDKVELQKWVVDKVLHSEDGMRRFGEKEGQVDVVGRSKRVVVVGRGKTVNFVV
ncbi:putative leucyl-trna synthetase protein [Botrytis fragariae]|uniref:leucine--tRNA ligase n=1 Tax=Botrytis fragariae TaxID=1964551 RepID=A0A8H6ENZ0_9HELO|nr:putative leucyl-trna synthetase protein [Botrytis fragariae]KAF5879346.1 putative leucyl-trna synthetase protein [Botrytis fragariae]